MTLGTSQQPSCSLPFTADDNRRRLELPVLLLATYGGKIPQYQALVRKQSWEKPPPPVLSQHLSKCCLCCSPTGVHATAALFRFPFRRLQEKREICREMRRRSHSWLSVGKTRARPLRRVPGVPRSQKQQWTHKERRSRAAQSRHQTQFYGVSCKHFKVYFATIKRVGQSSLYH